MARNRREMHDVTLIEADPHESGASKPDSRRSSRRLIALLGAISVLISAVSFWAVAARSGHPISAMYREQQATDALPDRASDAITAS